MTTHRDTKLLFSIRIGTGALPCRSRTHPDESAKCKDSNLRLRARRRAAIPSPITAIVKMSFSRKGIEHIQILKQAKLATATR
jgi:hypothetical protein